MQKVVFQRIDFQFEEQSIPEDCDYLDPKEVALREKQAKCPHNSFKCLCCGMAMDNVKSLERKKIAELEVEVKRLKSLYEPEKTN